jgi:hypothetical protein
MSSFFIYVVNVLVKMELSIENFIFLKIMGMNQILFGRMSKSLNSLFHLR